MNIVKNLLSLKNDKHRFLFYNSTNRCEITKEHFEKLIGFAIDFIKETDLFFAGKTSWNSDRYDAIFLSDESYLKNVLEECKYKSSLLFIQSSDAIKIQSFGIEVYQYCDKLWVVQPKLLLLGKTVSYYYSKSNIRDEKFSGLLPIDSYGNLFLNIGILPGENKPRPRVVEQIKDNLIKSTHINPIYNFAIVCGEIDNIRLFDFLKTRYCSSLVGKKGNNTVFVPVDYIDALCDYGKKSFFKKYNGFEDYIFSGINIGRFIPAFNGCSTFSCFFLLKKDYLNDLNGDFYNALIELINYFDSTLDSLVLRDANYRYNLQSVQSAVGSIMSRNGSHNIGSHVLAALSHNVGTMPDDRIMYQYIQQRMDYIATVTTDFPTWTQPTKFIGNLMKTFLSQKHLLNHIVGSEGLKAWEFQNPNIDQNTVQENRLRFHIRKQIGKDNVSNKEYKEFIQYPDQEEQKSQLLLNEDVSLAIPGGIVGQHAFYTIIENFVRNAAKHDWTTPPQSTKFIKENKKNLDVYIDFFDDTDKDFVRFTIWCNVSDVLDGLSQKDKTNASGNIKKILNIDELKSYLNREEANHIPLHWKQYVELIRPLINDDGKLRKENWGLAEMRISAGFLQKQSISIIGALHLNDEVANLIVPVSVNDNINSNNVYHLGYQFNVPKPKEILFVVEKIPDDFSAETDFKKNGIFIKQKEFIKPGDNLAYEYVVLSEFSEKELEWKLPFRVLSKEKCTALILNPQMIPKFDKYDECLNLIFESNDSISDRAKQIKKFVMGCWCKYIQKRRYSNDKRLQLLVQPTEEPGKTNSEKGLITDFDILKIVFEEEYNTAVRTFRELNPSANMSLVSFIEALRFRTRNVFKNPADDGNTCSLERLIALQLYDFIDCTDWYNQTKFDEEHCKNGIRSLDKPSLESVEQIKNHLNEFYDLDHLTIKKTKIKPAKNLFSDVKKEFGYNSIIARIKNISNIKKHPIDSFIDYLKSVHAQMDVFLRKYEERITTLPKLFSTSNIVGTHDNHIYEWEEGNIILLFNPEDKKKEFKSVDYVRHFNLNNNAIPENSDYIEPLSGTQSYLTELMQLDNSQYELIVKLIETALLRVLIVDERVAKFYSEHYSEIGKAYRAMGIWVVDDKYYDLKSEKSFTYPAFNMSYNNGHLLPLEKNVLLKLQDILKAIEDKDCESLLKPNKNKIIDLKDKLKSIENLNNIIKQSKSKFDVLIIHQGIIDKLLPKIAHDPLRMPLFLETLKLLFPYVVITTGRGTPANIPENAHLLPFPTIETTLFKKYPEKLVLIDTIMNILKVGRRDQ